VQSWELFLVIRTLLFGLAVATAAQFPVFAEREPPIRTGLWVMQPLPGNGRELSAFAAEVCANRELTGVCVYIHWTMVTVL